jgi:hypothetical protein
VFARVVIPASWRSIILGFAIAVGCSTGVLAVDTITGVARNQTRGQFAIGDEVILLRLDQARPNQDMQEEARTKTDSQGSFTLKVRFPDKLHLLRVVYQGVNYDQRVSVGGVVSVDVFDAASKVPGVSGGMEIIRAGTNENLLHVSDLVEIRNDSSPPRTQAGARTFEVYLPPHAKVDSVLAAGPGKIGMLISAVSVPGEPGHYAVSFPLRPGATKFAFNYDLPYDGHVTFRTRSAYPLQQLAVMIPTTMKFGSRSPAFHILPAGNSSYQVEAVNRVKAGMGPEFEILGIGALPELQVQALPKPPVVALPTPAISAPDRSRAQDQRPNAIAAASATGLAARSSRMYSWGFAAGTVLVLGSCIFLLWRQERQSATAITGITGKSERSGQTLVSTVDVLKQELFRLEVDRSQGAISGEEYDSAKQALKRTVGRALARTRTKP